MIFWATTPRPNSAPWGFVCFCSLVKINVKIFSLLNYVDSGVGGKNAEQASSDVWSKRETEEKEYKKKLRDDLVLFISSSAKPEALPEHLFENKVIEKVGSIALSLHFKNVSKLDGFEPVS